MGVTALLLLIPTQEEYMRLMLMSVLCALLFSSPIMAADSNDRQFVTLDKNHDNYLSKNEFLDGKMTVNKQKAVKLFPDMRDVEQMNDSALKENLFEWMDKNNDGLLSKDEWIQVAPNILEINF
jgi:hypothetical protein